MTVIDSTPVVHEPDLDVDAPAAAQLDIDAQRAGLDAHARVVRPNGGPTSIRFESKDDFDSWCDFGLIAIDPSPRMRIDVDWAAHEISVPVTFGWPYAWAAIAVFPTRSDCTCRAERVHMAGCPAVAQDEAVNSHMTPEQLYLERWHLAHPDEEIEVIVVDLPRRIPGATVDVHYTNLGLRAAPACGAKKPTVLATVVAANVTCPDCVPMLPTPGAAIVHELLPNEYDGFGGLTCDLLYTGSEPATTVAADVTCPDCLRWVTPTLAEQAREHAERRTGLVEPMTRFLRDAYSPQRAAEARELASVLIEEASGE